jgi:hypothetical protein
MPCEGNRYLPGFHPGGSSVPLEPQSNSTQGKEKPQASFGRERWKTFFGTVSTVDTQRYKKPDYFLQNEQK